MCLTPGPCLTPGRKHSQSLAEAHPRRSGRPPHPPPPPPPFRQSKILNFVVLIPSKEHCPLVLLDENGQPTSSSFAFPEWGGVSVLCPREASKTQQAQGGSIPSYFLSAGDLTEVVTAFTMQIRQLLGMRVEPIALHQRSGASFGNA